ncbi:Protein TIC 20-I, chloroplastic [Apostasia shenzhenica]|uniref:Protein TIC 20 n=1 Tax=Apostasia shenzhenica TaxID=1088818 RepID=A0A2I0AFD0_9ASPA|nr:Protein TIC 20-I, chloroplastic [Apostasia shenzhenica]
MNLNGWMAMSGLMAMKPRPFEALCASSSSNIPLNSTPKVYSNVKCWCRTSQNYQGFLPEGAYFRTPSNLPTLLLSGTYGSFAKILPSLLQHKGYKTLRGRQMIPRASKDVPSTYRYPPMTKKPRWWWRTLACIPYLMPLHETWMYAETAYHLHPFLEDFEFLTYPFLQFIGMLPSWFLMAYFFVAYLGIVRRKEWPHFFRFHVVMGMLLEIALQVVGTISRWLPLAIYWGKLGMHFWTAFAFAYLFTVLECIRCALAGMYADVPFACDAAYIQIPYD